MSRRLEKSLESVFRKNIHSVGGLAIKLPANLYRGIPDRLVILPGAKIRFVELKTDTGTLSKHQIIFRRRLFTLGFPVDIVSGKDELETWIKEHLSDVESPI
jgi:hypothetical protein